MTEDTDMDFRDDWGHLLTGASAGSLTHYRTALGELRFYRGDPAGSVDRALALDPDFVMAHALRAWLHLLGTEPAGLPVAREALASVQSLPMTERERGHVTSIGQLLAGEWHAAARTLEDLSIAWPLDALALQVGHQLDFFRGESRMLRDRIARALPAWNPGLPGYSALLGMHAFGLEETGDYARAERLGRRAVELDPRDGWAWHAVAHVMEMQDRQREGIAWLGDGTASWSDGSFFAVHNWWHLALFHLEAGETGRVLELFDGPIYGARSTVVLDMLDASALLWRLQLCGVDVGDRWDALADNWLPLAAAGNYAFNDAHAMLAFVGAGRGPAALDLLNAQEQALRGGDDNARFLAEVGSPVTRAILAFGLGEYAETVELLRPVRNRAHRFGGSHAQRDLLDLTLIEAASRAGQSRLASALIAERACARSGNPGVARLALRVPAEPRAAA
ncbi:MAG: tetratricopeptide repeat protein [Chromatiales bacterium]|nr:tetratricopeptide repeat protein [Chromatiales bacterium]